MGWFCHEVLIVTCFSCFGRGSAWLWRGLILSSLFFLFDAAEASVPSDDFSLKLAPAFTNLEAKGIALIGSREQRLLVDAAYASVAASACKGLKFRADEVDRRFSEIIEARIKKTQGSRQTLSIQVSTLYGAYLGLFISESYMDPKRFCSGVESVRIRKGQAVQFWETR